jgi:hypothetical protein
MHRARSWRCILSGLWGVTVVFQQMLRAFSNISSRLIVAEAVRASLVRGCFEQLPIRSRVR